VIPDHVQGISEQALDLLKKILTKNPFERISLGQVLEHEWFK
jgi:serine/threonine protein kinase